MARRTFVWLVTWALLPSTVCAQTGPKVVLVRQTLGVDAEKTIGLQRGPGNGASNSAKLNAWLRNTSQRYAIYFPGGDWYFGADTVTGGINGTCIETPYKTAITVSGTGGMTRDPGGGFTGAQATRLIYAGPRVEFDGTTIHASCTAGTKVLEITGYTVTDQDENATLEITGGTNFAAAGTRFDPDYVSDFYNIDSVSTENNTWTLDRDPTNGSNASAMVGVMTYTLWRDRGYGSQYPNLSWWGSADLNADPALGACHVLFHQDVNPGGGLNTGKARISHTNFLGATVGVMCGKNMASAYRMASPKNNRNIGYGNNTDYPGAAALHADNMHLENVRGYELRTLFYTRNSQSVGHQLNYIRTINCDEIAYCERTMKILLDDVHMGGGRKRFLRIGESTSNSGLAMLRMVTYDAQDNTGAVVAMDNVPDPGAQYKHVLRSGDVEDPWFATKDSTRGRVVIDGVHVPGGMDNWDDEAGLPNEYGPLISLYGMMSLEVRNWEERMVSNTILLKKHPDDTDFKPHASVSNVQMTRIGSAKRTHDGANNASVLSDSTQSWPVNGLVGRVIRNISDGNDGKGSSGTITANTATTITATLSGGQDNDWDTGDKYSIDPEHDGANGAAVLADSSSFWTTDQFVGRMIQNLTDGSRGRITANTGTTITATLFGGAENDWDTSDVYQIDDQVDVIHSDTDAGIRVIFGGNNAGSRSTQHYFVTDDQYDTQ